MERSRKFDLVRRKDVTGISGTGVVAEGVQFSDGTVVMRWLNTSSSREGVKPTTVVHEDIRSVVELHGHGSSTYVLWEDGSVLAQVAQPVEQ